MAGNLQSTKTLCILCKVDTSVKGLHGFILAAGWRPPSNVSRVSVPGRSGILFPSAARQARPEQGSVFRQSFPAGSGHPHFSAQRIIGTIG